MSDEKDEKEESQKTEEPTAHRLEQAFEKGQIAFSKEVLNWSILGTGALLLSFLSYTMGKTFQLKFAQYITNANEFSLDSHSAFSLMLRVGFDLLLLLAPILSFFVLAVIAGGLIQTRFAISASSLKPKLERISPLSGFKRLFSKRSIVEFLKGIFKIIIVGAVLYFIFRSKVDEIPNMVTLRPEAIIETLSHHILTAIIVIVCCLSIIATLDYLYQKYELMKNLRMTKEEVKKEHKEQEGDPLIRQKRRQMGQQRVKMNMRDAVSNSTVVITNPTHFAVAIQYDFDTMDAPVVVAKGMDYIALKMRELAKEFDVPIVENPPLARSLYSSLEIEQEILPEHYLAVAEVIRFVMKLKKQAF